MRARLLLGSLVALAACAPSVQSARFGAGETAPRPAEAQVRVYQQNRPTCAFTEVGWVSGSRRLPTQSPDAVLAAMRERAKQMGGDAIVGLVSGGSARSGTEAAGASDPLFSGTVVRFNDPGCTA
ncbi:MAG TPA: hypothetical protein VF665_10490 [Longimicrobium sp.]|jgi:hypothetical protein|uniref:hypothetical protein n=1 Tax=Longimicrobium sp. TaxID=2029185 RepID=UPI002EDA1834